MGFTSGNIGDSMHRSKQAMADGQVLVLLSPWGWKGFRDASYLKVDGCVRMRVHVCAGSFFAERVLLGAPCGRDPR